ncbi:MAG TPA: hypothetical protein PLB78_09365 [Anaerolineae bacterium]|nr:hypothetical protein [Anaerolineae bacterium]
MAAHWNASLRADPLPWLLASDDAALRYRVLVDLLGRPADDPEVSAAHEAIPGSPLVAAILAAQQPEGHWAGAESSYWPKYRATHWQMILLAELGLAGNHPAVLAGLRVMAARIALIGADDAVAQGEVLWCYAGNTLRYLSRFGLGGSEAARRAAARLAELGERDPQWTCEHAYDKTCPWGAIKALRGLAAMPAQARPAGCERLMAGAAELLLEHDYEANRAHAGVTNHGWDADWFKFGFPSFYESDLLDALDALAEAGYAHDPRYARLLSTVLERQDAQGRWTMENSFNGLMHADVETKGAPSRWLTLRALRAAKARG